MKNKFTAILSLLFIAGTIGLIYLLMMPQWVSTDDALLSEYSTKRALEKVKVISWNILASEWITKKDYPNINKSDLFNTKKRIKKIGIANRMPAGTAKDLTTESSLP